MAVERVLGAGVVRIPGHVVSDSMDVSRALMKDQEATVLFEDLNGSKAAGNLFSTREKIASALGVPKEGIVTHLMEAIASPKGCEIVEGPEFRSCEKDVRLLSLPVPKFFPEDGGRYITAGVIVVDLDGRKNVSFHRMMIMDDRRIAVRLVPRHLFTLYKESKAAGKELRVSICVGACAEVLLAAATSMDFGSDELEVASAMHLKGHGTPLKVGRCDNGILVPADCDYVMEARITLAETKEGPFVDITGTYDFERQQPVIEVDKVWTRKDPVFHLVLPGGYEHYMLMGLPREPMILKTVRQAVPRVRSVRLTEGGCCWLNGVVSIAKNKEGDGVNAIMAAFTGHPSMKQVIIVDDDIDIFDDRQVEWAVATRMQADRILMVPGAAGSSLDPSSHGKTTWKVGYDATMPLDADPSLFRKASLERPCGITS
ncbi:MAG: UbiD family decarboxylase [Candidatus Methanomethylophilaceae archaeon]|nr:UbiD family decarboxylase [Candidatus Methanomethylophilaceae archaeon]